ncbi:uncharacterized protein V1516DRAFT_628724 [Lipomyces oligophaga]|uniref:uncharacterized protein n=1 Tax=Lipomyces oligophaga TaxID=45792 RepID=UPI0034CD3528
MGNQPEARSPSAYQSNFVIDHQGQTRRPSGDRLAGTPSQIRPFPSQTPVPRRKVTPHDHSIASPSPLPPSSDPLFKVFKNVDKAGTGRLTQTDLCEGLLNFDRSKFDPATVRLLFHIFDESKTGAIDFFQFKRLWEYLSEWQIKFKEFDVDGDLSISFTEFDNALKAFQYNLTPDLTRYMFQTYDKNRTNSMSFDLFIQACVMLTLITASFKKYSPDDSGMSDGSVQSHVELILGIGHVKLDFEQFLGEMLTLR